ncbi:hypothetical protein [Streptomyces hiroshimensis]|uniref:Uncharacterized protein n=1 Tax=Streptomyces hiroshimensis TaxID=66424 RepID=A0ABQ2YAX8_9ACTN|nr:hypothetical protein [Streptomyces hiroshimensis]GGX75977.1 hypothetical protein GCM10010324_21900 [Streptomyces hiroshimensis]
MAGRVQMWIGGTIAGVAAAVLAVHLAVAGLEAADKWASVLSLFVGLAGLGVALAGLQRNRQENSKQSVEDSGIDGNLSMVSGTGGNVSITRRLRSRRPAGGAPTVPIPPAGAPSAPNSGQTVRKVTTSGDVSMVQDTGENVDIKEVP